MWMCAFAPGAIPSSRRYGRVQTARRALPWRGVVASHRLGGEEEAGKLLLVRAPPEEPEDIAERFGARHLASRRHLRRRWRRGDAVHFPQIHDSMTLGHTGVEQF